MSLLSALSISLDSTFKIAYFSSGGNSFPPSFFEDVKQQPNKLHADGQEKSQVGHVLAGNKFWREKFFWRDANPVLEG
jgi:hypothetical protein